MDVSNATRVAARTIGRPVWSQFPAIEKLNVIEAIGIASCFLTLLRITVLLRHMTKRSNTTIFGTCGNGQEYQGLLTLPPAPPFSPHSAVKQNNCETDRQTDRQSDGANKIVTGRLTGEQTC